MVTALTWKKSYSKKKTLIHEPKAGHRVLPGMTHTMAKPALQHLLLDFEQALAAHPLHQNIPKSLYEPASYILSLGGKRMRPLLVLSACELFSGSHGKALPQALAVELFHNFTLVHDDIMDEAPKRRGKPTIHSKWDVNTGILSGDMVLIEAYQELAKCEPSELPELLKIFNTVGVLVCEGQQLDMDFETTLSVSIEDYLHMISLKTAALLEGALQLGAIRGGASPQEVELIGAFGRNMGIGFQLQDDILDAYGDPEKFGKQVGGDIISNKKTYLLLTALKKAKGETREELLHWIKAEDFDKEEKVKAVLALYDQLDVKEAAVAEMNRFYAKADESLAAIQKPESAKSNLQAIVQQLRVREI